MEGIDWEVHPEVGLGLAVLASAYLLAAGPLGRRAGAAEPVAAGRVAAFLGGLAVVFVALTGPLHDLAERALFSAHMVQHLLLALIAPALLLLGTPGWMARALLRAPGAARLGRALTRPLVAFAVYTAVLLAWHLPLLYEAAMRDHGLHVVQHLLFMAAGVLLWWPVLGPLPELGRLAPPAQMLYLVLAGVPMVLVAAPITLAEEVLYPFYAEAPLAWGLTPLADQRAGGVIMWVPGTLVFLVAITIVFFRWARAEAEPEEPGRVVAPEGEPHGVH